MQGFISAQQNHHHNFKEDTSYTIYSAYKKCKEKYPAITIAQYAPINQLKIIFDITYHKYDNREMHLDLFQPKDKSTKNRPCVVLIHGGGWYSGNKSELENFAMALADRGNVAVCVEYRLSNEAIYPAAVQDIKESLKWLVVHQDKYKIDTSRIAIMGASAGGQLAALIGCTSQMDIFNDQKNFPNQKIRINAIVDIDGVLAFIHPLSEEGFKPGGSAEKWFGIHYKSDSTKWVEASALTYAGCKTPPVLFIASSFPRFNAGREEMIAILNKYGIYNEKHVFDDAPHSFWLFNTWFERTLTYILDFLEKQNTLKNK